ncbi:metallophosphoesterase [Porcipelethomonas sp.]|uniref:metallophosphoesterase n=1 Tax=Porcipelethomonas sp. TaxID=2981675 RepID=UPI003EF5113C
MSLFAIGDLHLAISDKSKSMSVFSGWDNYMELLEDNWKRLIKPEDTVVLAGDSSWAMNIKSAYEDFQWIEKMPGKKIFLKGNHDYWWGSLKKMNDAFSSWGFTTINILHNNHYRYENYGICGTRGWVNMPGEPADAKVLAREAGRLAASLESAKREGLEPLVFLHYPPVYGNNCNFDILEVLYKYEVKHCWYGHLHGVSIKYAINGERDGIDFQLISSDYLQFVPLKIL